MSAGLIAPSLLISNARDVVRPPNEPKCMRTRARRSEFTVAVVVDRGTSLPSGQPSPSVSAASGFELYARTPLHRPPPSSSVVGVVRVRPDEDLDQRRQPSLSGSSPGTRGGKLACIVRDPCRTRTPRRRASRPCRNRCRAGSWLRGAVHRVGRRSPRVRTVPSLSSSLSQASPRCVRCRVRQVVERAWTAARSMKSPSVFSLVGFAMRMQLSSLTSALIEVVRCPTACP